MQHKSYWRWKNFIRIRSFTESNPLANLVSNLKILSLTIREILSWLILVSLKYSTLKTVSRCQSVELPSIWLLKSLRKLAMALMLIGGVLVASFIKWLLVFRHITAKTEWNSFSLSSIKMSISKKYFIDVNLVFSQTSGSSEKTLA